MRNRRAFSAEKQAVFDSLLKRINGVLMSRDAKYIMMNAPRSTIAAISEFLPGADASPTILDLAGHPEGRVHRLPRKRLLGHTLESSKASARARSSCCRSKR
ncbi:MAG: hypothetical protein R3C58_08255 [Parvularculaceae bacterium]